MNDSRRIGVPQRGHGSALLAVDRERAVEVAALAVHVDVERVEGRTADAERLAEDRPDRGEQAGGLGAVHALGGARVVQPRAPECLVGVDVADARHQRLVEQRALEAGVAAAQRGRERRVVEVVLERVGGDVRELERERRPGA